MEAVLQSGDYRAREVLEKNAGLLALAVRNLISLFGPEMVLLVGRSSALCSFLAERVASGVHNLASDRWQGRTRIASAVYDPLKAGRGAADLVFKQFFS